MNKEPQNSLMADILAQGDNLTRVVDHLYGSERLALAATAAFLGKEKPVVWVGMASSQYLCMPAETYLLQRGRAAWALNAADAAYTLLPFLRSAGVVMVSRSGETAEIVRLAEMLAEAGTPFAAITNEPESRLAKLAAQVIWANTRKDALVSINVVTGLMAAVMALAAELTGERDTLRPEFDRAGAALSEVVTRAGARSAVLGALFAGVRPIHLLYRGYDRAAAFCGRLALEEVARTPGVPLEAAEFRQGPNEVIDERFGAAIFVGEGRAGALNRSLAEDIARSGGRTLAIGSVEDAGDGGRSLAFSLPALHEALRPLLGIVPLQFLAYELAQSQGYAPGTMRYITRVITQEEGIPKLGQK